MPEEKNQSAASRLFAFYSKFQTQSSAFRPAQPYFFDAMISFENAIGIPGVNNVWLDNFKYLLTEVDIPNFNLHGTSEGLIIKTPIGKFMMPGNTSITSYDELSLSFIDTDESIIENFFHPWMQYNIASNLGSKQFIRAKFTIWPLMQDGSTPRFQYQIDGAYPVRIQTPTMSQTPAGSLSIRKIDFDYNKVNVEPIKEEVKRYFEEYFDSRFKPEKKITEQNFDLENEDLTNDMAYARARLDASKIRGPANNKAENDTTKIRAQLDKSRLALQKNKATPPATPNKGSSSTGNYASNIPVNDNKKPIINTGEQNVLDKFNKTQRADEIIPASSANKNSTGDVLANKK